MVLLLLSCFSACLPTRLAFPSITKATTLVHAPVTTFWNVDMHSLLLVLSTDRTHFLFVVAACDCMSNHTYRQGYSSCRIAAVWCSVVAFEQHLDALWRPDASPPGQSPSAGPSLLLLAKMYCGLMLLDVLGAMLCCAQGTKVSDWVTHGMGLPMYAAAFEQHSICVSGTLNSCTLLLHRN